MSWKTIFNNLNPFLFVCLLILINNSRLQAQISSPKFELEAQAIGTTNSVVPFWMRSNQFGSIPLTGMSSSFLGRAHKEYRTPLPDSLNASGKLLDWGFGFEGRANVGDGSNIQLIEAYAKIKFGIIQLNAGRTKDVMGLNGDPLLSSGNFAISGNALGIPKIELSIPEYYRLPFFDGLFSIKANFVHGWVGRTRILDSIALPPPNTIVYYINDRTPKTYFHQKSLYARISRDDWKLKLYGGFNHQVFWGNEKKAYGSNFKLSSLSTFLHIITGKAYGGIGVPTSKIGNQLGSIDLGAEYDFNKYKVTIYHQSFYDVGALSKLANIRDGLTGVSIANKTFRSATSGFRWKKATFELFYSKDQAGYPWSIPTKSGDEDYYNNFYYLNGWSYKGLSLGNPFITLNKDARKGQSSRDKEYFINNRVIAIHTGLNLSLLTCDFMANASYSWNYGTFGSSIYGSSTGNIRNPQTQNIFKSVDQLSLYLEGSKPIQKGYIIGFSTAFDNGKLLDNSFGLLIKLKKRFN